MAASVQALNLTKVYPVGSEPVYALNDVSLEVNLGEMVAVLGRAGSGKSTLLHTLGCLQRPDSGEVHIEGLNVTPLDDQEVAHIRTRKFGFMYQAFNLLPNESAMANVEVSLRHQGEGAWDRQEKAAGALEVVGLGNRLDHKPGQLTARQRTCIAIARAMAHGPSVILCDEPTRILDSSSREEIIGLLQKLNEAGMTIIIATPDSGVASHCHRVVRMADGKAKEDDAVAKRRVISREKIPGADPPSYVREEELVCPRCNHGNPKDKDSCQQCGFQLYLSEEDEKSIEGRLSGAERPGVESDSDEGEVPGQDLIEGLKEVPFFAELGSKSLVKLIPAMQELRYPGGSKIVQQGDVGDSFYVIRSGKAEVVLERKGKPDIPIAHLGPMDAFGEMALLIDQPRNATVRAVTDVEAWRLPKSAFETLLSENLSLTIFFSRLLSDRLRSLEKKLTS